mmetsp:Transcript_14314/g.42226  ORF Transcript_14314/g.42226 Transcript_14314/m.42226 type:complete len:378 (-) Transcript_14314:825-1958(-)
MQRCRALCAAGTGAKGVIRIPAHRPIREPNCYQLVLLRHGESEWNFAKRFTGWVDVDLTETGRLQAARAGKVLKNHNFEFDEAHASVLKRAVRTLWTALHSSDHHWIPVRHTWRLNERHYGGLTGLSKKEAERELGKDMLLRYRRGYDTEPLPMEETHPYWTGSDRRYRDLGTLLPTGESLQQCKERILPYWYESIVPSIRAGRSVLVAAHNNVIRCLAKHLDHIPTENLRDLEIPTGVPIVYNLDKESLKPVGEPDKFGFTGRYLSDDDVEEMPSPWEQGVAVNEVLTLELLQREAHRLNLDLSGIKCVTDSVEKHGDVASASAASAPELKAVDASEPQQLADAGARPVVSIGNMDRQSRTAQSDPLDDWMQPTGF